MSCRYKEVPLGDVCIFGDGAHTKVKRTEFGVPYLTSKNIKSGYIDKENIDFISNEDYEKLFGVSQKSVRHLQEGDVLIGIIGTFGNCYLYKDIDRFGISSSIGIARPNKNILNSKFLYYYLSSKRFEKYTEMYKGGSVQGYTNLPTLRKIPIYLPPLEVQEKIANILSSLDDKIELNNEMNKTLEEMAQSIFNRWFVDFEFPNENEEPYKSSGGEMVDSELGMIPKGWEVKKIGDIIDITSGKRPKKKSKEKNEEFYIPLIGASSVMGYTDSILYNEKILVIGRVGTHGVVQRFNSKVWTSDNTLVIKSKYYEYVNQILKSIDYKSLNIGSTQPLITQTDIKNINIIYPNEDILYKFESITNDLYKKIDFNLANSQEITLLRDNLLPKLMSGEIRVN